MGQVSEAYPGKQANRKEGKPGNMNRQSLESFGGSGYVGIQSM